MPGSRQPADDVVAGPGLQSVGLQLGLGHAQGDRAGDLLYDRKGNASRPPLILLPQAVGGRLQPGAELATEPAAEGAGAGEDRRHHRRPTAVRELQLKVVDLAGVLAVLVDQLPVEQLQPGLEDPSGHRGQLPALVSTSNGIVATATTWEPQGPARQRLLATVAAGGQGLAGDDVADDLGQGSARGSGRAAQALKGGGRVDVVS